MMDPDLAGALAFFSSWLVNGLVLFAVRQKRERRLLARALRGPSEVTPATPKKNAPHERGIYEALSRRCGRQQIDLESEIDALIRRYTQNELIRHAIERRKR